MAVQQNKKSPSRRGMHRSHDHLTGHDLPSDLLKRRDLATRAQALAEIHFPPDDASIADYEMFRSTAHKRLIFDEFFWELEQVLAFLDRCLSLQVCLHHAFSGEHYSYLYLQNGFPFCLNFSEGLGLQ